MKLFNKRFQLHLEVKGKFMSLQEITNYLVYLWNLIQRIHKQFHIQKLPIHIENLCLADCYGCDVGRMFVRNVCTARSFMA